MQSLDFLRGYLYPADKLYEDEIKLWQTVPAIERDTGGKRRKMQNFVISGKARTVFRLIELKAKREEMTRRGKKDGKNRK